MTEYKNILSGIPQILKSKFAISYQLILNLTSINNLNFKEFIERSMMQEDIVKSKINHSNEIDVVRKNIELKEEQIKSLSVVPKEDIEKYVEINRTIRNLNNKKRKNAERELSNIKEKYVKSFENDKKRYEDYIGLKNNLENLEYRMDETDNYIINKCSIILELLRKKNYVEMNDNTHVLTIKGKIASNIHETHCLAMTEFIYDLKGLNNLTTEEIVGLLSIFTNIRVHSEIKKHYPDCNNNLKYKIQSIVDLCSDYMNYEIQNYVSIPFDVDTITYDIINECIDWCNCEDEYQCKTILKTLNDDKEIFLGEFVKALLKINNISSELETICEMYGNVELLSKLKQIPEKTMKFIATNQSLYV
jgi:superfamily II RNA helicase